MSSGSNPSQTFPGYYRIVVTSTPGQYTVSGGKTNSSITIRDYPDGPSDDLNLLGDIANDPFITGTGTTANLNYVGTTGTPNELIVRNLNSQVYFLVTPNTYASGTVINNAGGTYALCFCSGTLIGTIGGEVPVERLAIGDIVVTYDGETRPVKWIGRQTIAARFADPLRAYPVRVRAGAIAEGVPARDLFLSPDHALLIDGVLVQAGALVNGTTVTRVTDPEPRFTYYHVELDDHSVIFAEDAPAETFVGNVTRRTFDNYAEYVALFGSRADFEAMPDRDEPRAMSARQLPPQIRERMAERAAALMRAEPVAA